MYTILYTISLLQMPPPLLLVQVELLTAAPLKIYQQLIRVAQVTIQMSLMLEVPLHFEMYFIPHNHEF